MRLDHKTSKFTVFTPNQAQREPKYESAHTKTYMDTNLTDIIKPGILKEL